MATDVLMAKMGPEMESALLTEWLVADGAQVEEGTPIATIETDKITTDLEAPASGRIEIFAAPESECAVGERLAAIRGEGEAPDQASSTVTATVDPPAVAGPADAPGDGAHRSSLRASPVARRIAADRGVDLEALAAASPGEPVRKRDVLAAVEAMAAATAPVAPPVPPTAAPAEREPLSPMRRRIARRMVASLQETAQITDFREHDVTDLVTLRGEGSKWAKRLGIGGLSYTDLFVRATVLALAEVPALNMSLEGENELVRHGDVNVGIAVAIPEGLIVPVLHRAQEMSLAEIHAGVAALVDRARAGTLSLAELAGGTFTLTNIGSYGSHLATPILVQGQVGILGTGAFLRRPVVRDDAVVIGTTMYTSLTIDHRLVDGKAAGAFQTAIGNLLAEPERLL